MITVCSNGEEGWPSVSKKKNLNRCSCALFLLPIGSFKLASISLYSLKLYLDDVKLQHQQQQQEK
jgi:hypothetical protein